MFSSQTGKGETMKKRLTKKLKSLADRAWMSGAQNAWDTEIRDSYSTDEVMDHVEFTEAWGQIIRLDAEKVCSDYIRKAYPGGA